LSHKRPVNEDRCLVLEDRGLFVVCDGVGGHNSGEVASQLAVDTIEEAITHGDGEDVETLLENAVRYANRDIFEMASSDARFDGMGTTVALLYVDERAGRAVVGHAGDSRVYRYDGRLHRETYDHTDLDDAIRAGRITRQQATALGKQNTINRALGIEAEVQAEFKTIPLEEGNAFLLCSDGVTRHIDDDEIADLFAGGLEPDAMCEEIRSRCYARGAEDNLTAVVVYTAPSSAGAERGGRARRRIEFPQATARGALDRTAPASRTRSTRTPWLVALALVLGAAGFFAGRASVAWLAPPPPPEPPGTAARAAFERGDFAGARAAFTRLAAEDPRRADYQYWLGRAFLAEGDPGQAASHLEEAARLDARDRDIYLYLAAAYQSAAKPKEAADALRRYAEAAPAAAAAPPPSATNAK
jgi:protein phosphatase